MKSLFSFGGWPSRPTYSFLQGRFFKWHSYFYRRPQPVVDVDDPIELEGVWELNQYDSRGRGRGEIITVALLLA